MDIPSPAHIAGAPFAATAWPPMPTERDTSHDSMVSSTSNIPSSSEARGSDAASVLLYQSSNSGKDPRLWNVQEVTNFMYSIGCSNYADAFVKEVCVFLLPLLLLQYYYWTFNCNKEHFSSFLSCIIAGGKRALSSHWLRFTPHLLRLKDQVDWKLPAYNAWLSKWKLLSICPLWLLKNVHRSTRLHRFRHISRISSTFSQE